MEGRATIVKNRFTKSIGTGLGALTSGGREYYVLEHKNDSKNFRAGQQKEIIVDYLELGRDARCGIRYSEQEKTISRRHAAITKENGSWVLLNLSKTNPTLLNGRPVSRQYYITSGDEIQLSSEGPKLGFIVPNNNKTGSLSIGKRMTLFGEQALRPYKRALWAMGAFAAVCLVCAFYFGGVSYNLKKENTDLQTFLAAKEDTIGVTKARELALAEENKELLSDTKKAKSRARRLKEELNNMQASAPETTGSDTPALGTTTTNSTGSASTTSANVTTALSSFYDDVYLIEVSNVKVTQSNEAPIDPGSLSWYGTGFLTKDNRFITTRQVIEPWSYTVDPVKNPKLVYLNVLLRNFGVIVDFELTATSRTGKKLKFKLKDFEIDHSRDILKEVTLDDKNYIINHALNNPNSIAWTKIEEEGKIETAPDKSETIEANTKLFALGYPMNLGIFNNSGRAPDNRTLTVRRAGIENNTIITRGNGVVGKKCGGPVFIKAGNQYKVIGVLSGGWDNTKNKVVPINSIY